MTAIKQAILQSQYRAAKNANREQLSLYFGIGRYISDHSREGYWGTGAIESISEHKVTEVEERLFYIHQTYLNKWDKYKLRDLLKADLYHHQG